MDQKSWEKGKRKKSSLLNIYNNHNPLKVHEQKEQMNRTPLSFQNSAVKAKNAAIKTRMPGPYESFASHGLNADELLGFDKFARTALETYKDGSYLAMPTNNWREMRDFFCEKNYLYLIEQIESKSGYPAHRQSVWEAMMFAFYQIRPRSDHMDPRIGRVDQATVDSYVREINQAVLRRMVPETVAAQRNAVVAQNIRRGKRVFPDTPIDARSRLVGSMYEFDYMLR